MHEASLLRDLRRKLVELGTSQRGGRITGVRLWVGALSHLSEPGLRRQWDEVAAGTTAQGARLDIERSQDVHDPRATALVLVSIDVDEAHEGSPRPL